MTRSEGSWGHSDHKWYAYCEYSVSSTNTTTTLTVTTVGFASSAWGFDLSSVTANLSATGQTAQSASDSVYTSTGQTKDVPIMGTKTFSWTRGTSAASKTVSYNIVNSSGYMNGTSSGSFTVNVPAKPSYTVSYNANGGSGAPSSQTKWYGTALTLSSTKPTRTGYTFKNWNTASGGSGTSYSSGGSYTANASATLYAQWTANTYTVSYNKNTTDSVSYLPSSQTKTYGKALTLATIVPVRSNYKFLGYATSASGSVAYQPGGSYTANSAVTLYAKWQLNYVAPTISNLKAVRCDSDGTYNEEGTCCQVSFTWVDNEELTPTSVSATVNNETLTQSASGTSGSYSQIFGTSSALSINSRYKVTANVVDAQGSSTKSTYLNRSFFTLDVLAGGHGIAIGRSATREGFLQTGMFIEMAGADVGLYAADPNSEGLYHRFFLTSAGNVRSDISTDNINWTTEHYFVKEIDAGFSLTVNMNTAGYITSSATNVRFSVPLSRPPRNYSLTVTCTTKGTVVLRGINGYSHGTDASEAVTPSSVSCSLRSQWIDVNMVMSSTTNAVNNTPIGIAVSGMVLTFS